MKTEDKIIALLEENGPTEPVALWYRAGVKLGSMTSAVARLISDKRIVEVARDGKVFLELAPTKKKDKETKKSPAD